MTCGADYCVDIYLPADPLTLAILGVIGAFLAFRFAVYMIRTLPFT